MRKLLVVLMLAGCGQPPEQPELLTYGAGAPTCLLFCTVSTIFADLAESSQLTTTTGGDQTTSAASDSGKSAAASLE